MTPQEQAALFAALGITERDQQRIRDMVDEAVRRSAGPPGPVIMTLLDLEAEARVFCHQPGRDPPYDGTYIGTRQGWRIYAAALTDSERRERARRR